MLKCTLERRLPYPVADRYLLREKGVNGLRKNAYGYWSSGSEA